MDDKKYTRSEINSFEKIMDLFTNSSKMVDAELLLSENNQKIYLREWYPAHSGYAWEYAIVETIAELKVKLMEEVENEIISQSDVDSICRRLEEMGNEYNK